MVEKIQSKSQTAVTTAQETVAPATGENSDDSPDPLTEVSAVYNKAFLPASF